MFKLPLNVIFPLVIGAVLLVAQGVSVLLDIQTQKQQMIKTANTELINTGYQVAQSMPELLARNVSTIALQELSGITLSTDIHEVTLIGGDGKIYLSNIDAWLDLDVSHVGSLNRLNYETAMHLHQPSIAFREALLQMDLYMPASVVQPLSEQGASGEDDPNGKNSSLLLIRSDLNQRWSELQRKLYIAASEKMAIIIAVMLFLFLMLRRIVTNPLRQLNQSVELLGDPSSKSTDHVSGLGEIAQLTATVNSKVELVGVLCRELKRSEQRWQFTLNSSGDGVCDWDLLTNRVDYSPQWARMLGYEPEEIGDTVGEWESRIHSDDLNNALSQRRNSLQGNNEGKDSIHRLKTKSGGYIWVLVRRMIVERNESNQPTRMIISQSNITENRAAKELIKYQAHYDDVTRLSNRRHLLSKLEVEIERSKTSKNFGALIYLDIDNFKHVNDMLGHSAGDLLLRLIAHRLSDGRQAKETVARLGGDEFALLLSDLSSNSQEAARKALSAVDNIRKRMSKQFTIKGSDLDLTFTTGVAMFPNIDSNSTEILRQADIALYQGKDMGRSGVHFFADSMAEKVQERHRLQQMMRHAITNEEMTLYYQPRYNSDYEMVGAETLLRWFDKDSGWISPGHFIPLAEESGLIVPLGSWVMRGACRALKKWEDRGCPKTFETLSVNVSPKQFHRRKFVQETLAIIREEGCSPNLLELEITEGMLVDNVDATIEKIQQLRAIGVRFSVDDFGTGYSSLAYLNKLPINCLKIDKSFINEVQNGGSECAIISTIIAMAKNLELEVIAEGVETEYQLAFLKYRGCFVYQGFYFSEALEPELLEERLFVTEKALA